MTLALAEQVYAWELRKFWALGLEVVVVLDPEQCELPRVRGLVTRVASSGSAAWMDDGLGEDVHLPCAAILALRRPSYQEDGSAPRRRAPLRAPEQIDGQLVLDFPMDLFHHDLI